MARSLFLILLLLVAGCGKAPVPMPVASQPIPHPSQSQSTHLVAEVREPLPRQPLDAAARLRKAHAEADRLDPGWQMAELESRRRDVPADRNSVPTILKVSALLPDSWPNFEFTEYWAYNTLPPQAILTDEQAQQIRGALARTQKARTEARKLLEQPWGRMPVVWNKDYFTHQKTMPRDMAIRGNVRILHHYGVLLHAHEGKIEEAALEVKSLAHVARTVGDEPTYLAMLLRMFVFETAIRMLERVLAHGEVREETLAGLQGLIEDEVGSAVLLIALRGERAFCEIILQALADGEFSPGQVKGLRTILSPDLDDPFKWIEVPEEDFQRGRPTLFRYLTEAVEIAKLPIEQQRDRFDKLESQLKELLLAVRQTANSMVRFVRSYFRAEATLRSAWVALAVERYRLAERDWPERLEQLVPKYLGRVVVDPLDGKPIRYRKLPEGVVVYSVGEDRKDDGGNIFRKGDPFAPGTDLGFQLWNVKARHIQPK